MFLHDECAIEEIRKKIKKFLEFNENESTTYQNLWDKAKSLLMRKFIAMSAYIKNTEKSQRMIQCFISNSWKNKNKQNPKQEEGEK
jgi:hypothetical protein